MIAFISSQNELYMFGRPSTLAQSIELSYHRKPGYVGFEKRPQANGQCQYFAKFSDGDEQYIGKTVDCMVYQSPTHL